MIGEKLLPTKYEKYDEDLMGSLQRAVNNIFDDFTRMFEPPTWKTPRMMPETFMPRMELAESETAFHLAVELPGIDEKDVQLTVQDDVVYLRGRKKETHDDRINYYYRAERPYGSFARTIQLPCDVAPEKVTAVFQKGVLTVLLPKTIEAQKLGKTIPIKIS